MILVGITLFLILIGVGFFAYGAIALSKYAFRLGTGPGLLTLLFPPYTFYFAMFKLEEDGKSWPTASFLFGIVVTVLLSVAFYPDLNALASGDMERFEGPTGAGAAAVEKYGTEEDLEDYESDEASDEAPAEEEKPAGEEPAAEADAGSETAAEADAGSAAAEEGDAGSEVAAEESGE